MKMIGIAHTMHSRCLPHTIRSACVWVLPGRGTMYDHALHTDEDGCFVLSLFVACLFDCVYCMLTPNEHSPYLTFLERTRKFLTHLIFDYFLNKEVKTLSHHSFRIKITSSPTHRHLKTLKRGGSDQLSTISVAQREEYFI